MNIREPVSSSSTEVRSWTSTFKQPARALVLVTGVAAAISLLARFWWVADLIANLRVQLILGCLAAVICSMAARQWKLAGVSVAILVWQCSWLWSAFSARPENFGGPQLTVCSINVLTQNRQHHRIIQSLRESNADVIAILELGTELQETLIHELGDKYTHRILQPQDNDNFGIGLLSRLPFQGSRIFHLSAPPVPSIEADVEWQGRTIRIMATHPLPPMNDRYYRARNLQLELLAKRVQTYRKDEPENSVIVVGDLNLAPWSPLFHDFLAASSLQNASLGRGLTPTWYRWNYFPCGLVLDHGFSTDDLVCADRQVLGDVGSDHRPVVFRFEE